MRVHAITGTSQCALEPSEIGEFLGFFVFVHILDVLLEFPMQYLQKLNEDLVFVVEGESSATL